MPFKPARQAETELLRAPVAETAEDMDQAARMLRCRCKRRRRIRQTHPAAEKECSGAARPKTSAYCRAMLAAEKRSLTIWRAAAARRRAPWGSDNTRSIASAN